MGVRYGVFNHTRKEYVHPEPIPVDGEDPIASPYSAFITYLLVYNWRHDHVVILDDSGDIECDWELGRDYKDRTIELWNEFVINYKHEFPGLYQVEG
jgi:hypothetical protein